MKNTFFTLLILSAKFACFAQDDIGRISDSLVAEGKKLYKSEMASWYGTDVFLEKYSNRENIGGYFSYTDDGISKCVYFSKGDIPKVIGTISFDSGYNLNTAIADLTEREFTKNESGLFTIRALVLKIIKTDTTIKVYRNTNLNLIPLISGEQRKVYVLTGPTDNGIVIFGNDFLFTFDVNNQLTSKKHLHRNIISMNYGVKIKKGEEAVATIHSHLPETGYFITPTDICTLMLYEKYAKWQQHIVVSEKYVSIWDCNKNSLTILTKDAWNNIYNDKK